MREELTKEQLSTDIADGATVAEIARATGYSKVYIYLRLREYEIELPSRDLPAGTRFRSLVVVSRQHSDNGTGRFYQCRCDCGRIVLVKRANLSSGNTGSCGCSWKRCGNRSPRFKGYMEVGQDFWSQLLRSAHVRDMTVDITIEFAWELFIKQGRRCALSDLPIKFTANKRHDEQTASLDRIDSTKGYTEDNVQWTHKDVNRMKQHFDEKYFLSLCRRIAAHESR